MEFEHIRKRYWGQRFWGRGYFSTTAGNITEDVVMAYLDRHTRKDGLLAATEAVAEQLNLGCFCSKHPPNTA